MTVRSRPSRATSRPPTTADSRGPERERGDREPRLQRREPEAGLEVQREHQPDPAEADEVDGAEQRARRVAGGAGEQPDVEQRLALPRAHHAPLPRGRSPPPAPPRHREEPPQPGEAARLGLRPAAASGRAPPRRAGPMPTTSMCPRDPLRVRGMSRAASTQRDDADRHVDVEDPAPPVGPPASARITPPMIGPTAVEIPTVAPKKPNARPRSASRNICWMSAEFCGASEPAAIPCASRAITSDRGVRCGARRRAEQDEAAQRHEEHRAPPDRVPQPSRQGRARARTSARSRRPPTAPPPGWCRGPAGSRAAPRRRC